MYFTIPIYAVIFALPYIIAIITEKFHFRPWLISAIASDAAVFGFDTFLQSIDRSAMCIDATCIVAMFAAQLLLLIPFYFYALQSGIQPAPSRRPH